MPGNKHEIECISITLPPPSSLIVGGMKPRFRVPGASGALEEGIPPKERAKEDILFFYEGGKRIGWKWWVANCGFVTCHAFNLYTMLNSVRLLIQQGYSGQTEMLQVVSCSLLTVQVLDQRIF